MQAYYDAGYETDSMPILVNTKHLYNICTTSGQRRRCINVLQMFSLC